MGTIPAVASLSAAAVASLNELQLQIQFQFSGSAQLLSFYHQKIPETGPSPPPPPPVLSNKAFFVFVMLNWFQHLDKVSNLNTYEINPWGVIRKSLLIFFLEIYLPSTAEILKI